MGDIDYIVSSLMLIWKAGIIISLLLKNLKPPKGYSAEGEGAS